jgi:hypothetical protein
MWIVLEHKQTREMTEYKSIQEAMKALTLSRIGLRTRYVIHQKYSRGYWTSIDWKKQKNEKEECLITND